LAVVANPDLAPITVSATGALSGLNISVPNYFLVPRSAVIPNTAGATNSFRESFVVDSTSRQIGIRAVYRYSEPTAAEKLAASRYFGYNSFNTNVLDIVDDDDPAAKLALTVDGRVQGIDGLMGLSINKSRTIDVSDFVFDFDNDGGGGTPDLTHGFGASGSMSLTASATVELDDLINATVWWSGPVLILESGDSIDTVTATGGVVSGPLSLVANASPNTAGNRYNSGWTTGNAFQISLGNTSVVAVGTVTITIITDGGKTYTLTLNVIDT